MRILRSPLNLGGGAAAPAATVAQGRNGAARPLVPFTRAAHRHLEPAFDVTATVGASTQALGPFEIPAYGFIRNIVLLVTASGGALGGGTLTADAPFNVIRDITVTDPNGFPTIPPVSGYSLYLMNELGGYRAFPVVASQPGYSASVNPSFVLRLPFETTARDGFGSLSNQNDASPFRVRITLGTLTDLVTGGAPTAPAVRVRGYLEAWSPVAGADMLGQPQATTPPGFGAVQQWSISTKNVSTGFQTIELDRVGNLIRAIVLVFRDSGGARSATVEPDELDLYWDLWPIASKLPNQVHRSHIYETFGLTLPTGVLAFPWTDDEGGFGEQRDLWLPSVNTSRLELQGTFGAAGTVEVLTNDVQVTAAGR
jgi:hypothetical protein